ncbi:hypothetical protein Bca4012_081416 [Brassica carinata]
MNSNNHNGYHTLWTDGLICAFEFHQGRPNSEQCSSCSCCCGDSKKHEFKEEEEEANSRSFWRPIGWDRLSELVQTVKVDWSVQNVDVDHEDDDDTTVAELAAPYWERPLAGPTWWCHVDASHRGVASWLRNAQWLHPAVSVALRDESKLISERMKHIFYEVPVRVAGGLLFELLGQSAGDPFIEEDDIPIVLRSWQSQNFVVTALHVKGFASNISVLGITEVQEMLIAGGACIPRTIHELIAHLACRLARWDDRLFRKYIFGAADEENVIRVKWSLHAREEIVFELLQQLKGNTAKDLLEGIRKSTRDMINEQEAVRGRLFTIQDVMQNTVRSWLQDRSLTVTHNLGIFGGVGLLLTIVTGLFGINVDGIPGAADSPQAFALFSAILFFSGFVLVVGALLYLGLKEPEAEKNVEIRKQELDEMVKKFQREAESHAQVFQKVPQNIERTASSSTSSRMLVHDPNGYVLLE